MPGETQQTVRDDRGQWTTRPSGAAPVFGPGNAGKPPALTPDAVEQGIDSYIEDRIATDRPITRAGLAVHLGVSRETLRKYQDGKIGLTDDVTRSYVAAMERFNSIYEDALESELQRKTGQTQGVVFALKNRHGWVDQRHITQDSTETQVLQVLLPDGSALRERLEHGITIDHDTVDTDH